MNTPIDKNNIPTHVAIIMDGNGRWAKAQGEQRTFGHQHGVEAVRSVIEGAGEIGVKYLTLYAFSSENWNRPKEEVDTLMSLLVMCIHNELEGLMKNHVRLLAIGDLNTLPETCRTELQKAIDTTAANKGLSVILALSYGARPEMVQATKEIGALLLENKLSIDAITTETISQHLYTRDIPDPDLLIRTGGESRISNFLLWQLAYTELFFVDKMWPDFRKQDLWEIIGQFQQRERRFGKTGEQVRK